MKRNIFLFNLMLISFLSASTVFAEELRIATGHTFIKRVFAPIRSAFREKTGVEIKITYSDPIPALAELEKGNVDVAGASLKFEDWLELAKNDGVPVKEKSAYTTFIPASENMMITVNVANNLKSLSKEQLKGIFTGKILNWKEVGGADSPIIVVWPSVSSGALVVFKTKIMDNEPLIKTVYDVETIHESIDAIVATPEAIGVVTGNKPEAGLKEIAPSIERPLTLAYKGKPAPALQKLLDFLKGEGKKLISAATH